MNLPHAPGAGLNLPHAPGAGLSRNSTLKRGSFSVVVATPPALYLQGGGCVCPGGVQRNSNALIRLPVRSNVPLHPSLRPPSPPPPRLLLPESHCLSITLAPDPLLSKWLPSHPSPCRPAQLCMLDTCSGSQTRLEGLKSWYSYVPKAFRAPEDTGSLRGCVTVVCVQ